MKGTFCNNAPFPWRKPNRVFSPLGVSIILLLIMLNVPLLSQTIATHDTYRYSVAYFGNNLWNPGLKVGFEYVWRENMQKEWVPGAAIGFYLDPGSHAGIFSNAGIGYRRTNENGRTRYAGLYPVGLYRSFLTESYQYDNQGAVERVTLPGNFYYAPAFSIGIGKFTEPDVHAGWFTRLTIITLVPYNHWVMPLINLEAGIIFGRRGGAR